MELSPHVKREVAGSALLLFAVFLVGALVAGGRGEGATGCAAAGGVFGPVGSCLRAGLIFTLGVPTAWLLPLIPAVHGLRLFGRLQAAADRSWLVFLTGLVLLVPVGISLGMGGPREITAVAGLWGSLSAFYLVALFGRVGGFFVFALAVSALTAATLYWNPLRVIVGPGPRRRRRESSGGAFDGSGALLDPADEVSGAVALLPAPVRAPDPELSGDGRAARRRKQKPVRPTESEDDAAPASVGTVRWCFRRSSCSLRPHPGAPRSESASSTPWAPS